MASQRSLPFSPSTPDVPVSKRPSKIPSSLSTVGLSTKFESVITPRAADIPNSVARHARSGSTISTTSRSRPILSISGDGEPITPSRRAFTFSNSTHAPGILPPPPFFHPSRPHQPPLSGSDVSRPSSVASSNALSPLHGREAVQPTFALQPLAHDVPYDSDGHSDTYPVSGGRTSRNSMQDALSQLPIRNQKQSREPLLPLSDLARSRSGSLATHRSRPSLARNAIEKNAANAGAAARMRHSFERFRKGLSLESMRRSLSGPGSATQSPVMADSPSARSVGDGPTAFEIKGNYDEEYKASSVVPLDLRHQSSATFIPYPPSKSEHPLSSVPVKHEKSFRYVRNHERISSSNRWFMRGRLLVGGDKPWAFIGSLMLVFGIAGVWFGTTCVWWWHNKSPAVAAVGVYMCLLTISLMLSTAFKDPGILPRNLDPNPPYPSVAPSDGSDPVPLPRDLKVRSAVVRVKYCTTCCTYRPPRSSHCRMCDNCVDGCDHHCQWVNNCVGRRNYTNFFGLILMATLTLCLVVATSALHLSLLVREDHVDFNRALDKGAGSAIAFCLSITVIWPVGALLMYHVRLLYLNVTTIEQIRNSAHKSIAPGPTPPNPFAHSSRRGNLADVLCRPGGFSWVEPHAVATEDKRLVNPGFEDQADFVVHDEAEEGRYV
ncbi:DHHC palmitoyltransferase-domain-containing protein [Multifurca ochricompacta]|uniref:Palmitoyltransferase n=1 Tax=Multifurca ochricompacta TaxID=376703 RepID=A0AAD4MB51_9AGAM|nr:DHHC palmitoyltransferase-domain-containing protein [Multifurca ochricompacta]